MTIIWWIVELTATAALLAVLVSLVCRMLPHRPALHHLLWLVVLAKFLTPPWITWQVPAPRWLAMSARLETTAIAPEAVDADVIMPNLIPVEDGSSSTLDSASQVLPPLAEPTGNTSELSIAGGPVNPEIVPTIDDRFWARHVTSANFGRVLGAIWLIGALVIAWRSARQIARYARLLRNPLPTPQEITLEVGRLAQRLGVRPIPIRVAREVSSPFIWCLGRVTLVWPASMADPSDLDRWRGVMAHELAHIRRRDHWTVWLDLLAGIVWWWHPVFWFVRRRLRQSAEAACDALAISALPAGRQAYAEAFLELSQLPLRGQPSPALGVGWRDATSKSFERRLAMILSERVKSRVSLPGLAAAGLLALVALPGWSLSQAEEAKADAVQSPPPAAEVEPPAPVPADRSPSPVVQPIPSPAIGLPPTAEPLDPTVTARFYADAEVQLDADLQPEFKFELARYATIQITCADHKINRLKIEGNDAVLVRKQTTAGFRVSGKKEGSAKILLWDGVRQIATIEIKVLAVAAMPVIRQNPPRTFQSAAPAAEDQATATERVGPDIGQRPSPTGDGLKSAQVDVTNLGVAIITAEGELKLSRLELAYTEKLVGDKVVSNNELEMARTKAQTAEQKLQFLKRLAQAAYESARHELEYQTKALERIKRIREAVPASQFDQREREYQAAKDKVALLETIPGVKAATASDNPAKAD